MNFSNFFEGKTVLVLGGTGSIGSEIVSQILNYNPKTIRILSNSEYELWEKKLEFKKYEKKLRFLLGDIRNYERINRAIEGVDLVFNAAAIKHVPISEYNPMEAINVNIHGLENIIEASFKNNVEKMIHISTDKAVNPTTVMGATKMLSERLCISRSLAKGSHITKVSCVRFGNVLGSRGSIIPLIKKQIKCGSVVTLTDAKMIRFFMSKSQAVELVLKAAILAQGGEIFVLKMPVVYIRDLIDVIIEEYAPKVGKDPSSIIIETIGPRLGEKINEKLISSIEFSTVYEIEDMFCIFPYDYFGCEIFPNKNILKGRKISSEIEKFDYSTDNITPLTKNEISALLNDRNLL